MPTSTSKKSARPDDESIRTRRERKRATDRVAQREHRRRQKMYIEDLESQLALVREGSTSQQVGELMRENKALRDQLDRYRAFFNSVEDLVMDEWQDKNRDGAGQQEETDAVQLQPSASSQHIAHPETAGAATNSAITSETQITAGSGVVTCPDNRNLPMLPSNGEHLVPTSIISSGETQTWNRLSPPGAFDWFSSPLNPEYFNHSQIPAQIVEPNTATTPLLLGNALTSPSLPSGDLQMSMMDVSAQEDRVPTTTEFSAFYHHLLPTSPNDDLDPGVLFTSAMQRGPLLHQILPSILEPSTPQDQHVHLMIQRARSRSTRLEAPTLTDFLFENPDNTLSTDLKQYLEPVKRKRRTAEFFATYWVLYLLLRWQINRDEESFHKVPVWLRPTVLQIKVQHDIAADLLAWPLIRDELIMMSLQNSNSLHEILAAIGASLEVSIPMQDFTSGNGDKLHAAITDLKNWKLKSDFFEAYPSLRPLYDRSLQQYA